MPEIASANAARRLIDACRHCPLCGSLKLSREAGVLACMECGHLDFNNPVTAVAVFAFDGEGRVLLIRRAKEPARGKWAPPGGFLDAGETLEQAAAREAAEETALVLRDIRYLSAFPNDYVYRNLSRPVCDVFFTARVESAGIALRPEEAQDHKWLAAEEIDPGELAFDSMRHALAVLRKRISQ